MHNLAGFSLAFGLAVIGYYLADFIGIGLMGMERSPVSPIMMAIVLGVLVRNTLPLPAMFDAGIKFSMVRLLRLGIILLGMGLSLGQVGEVGLKSLPVVVVCVIVALVVVTWLSKRIGLSNRLGTLIAAGTGICGATAIVALAPAINAKDEETSYAVASIALFGMIAMLVYPFLAHWMFDGNAFQIGLFLGTAVHDTSQVAGSGMVYQQYFGDSEVLDTAMVTKLIRNLGMLLVIPILSVLYHRSSGETTKAPKWWTMVPLFVVGFALMSLLRTIGDMGTPALGFLSPEQWSAVTGYAATMAKASLSVAMAAVGLGTSFKGLRRIGFKPLGVGLFSALLVGLVSYSLITLLY